MSPGEFIAGSMIALAIVVAALSRAEHRRVALFMAGAVVFMRIVIEFTPADWRYLASAATWISVGSATIRLGLVRPGAFLILSGLCYAAQQQYGASPTFGNPALVVADLLWLAALGVTWHAGRVGQDFTLGRNSDRRRNLACSCVDDAAQAARK